MGRQAEVTLLSKNDREGMSKVYLQQKGEPKKR